MHSELRQTHDLPEPVGVLVVDTKGFSGHSDPQQQKLQALIPDVLERAAKKCGLQDMWMSHMFPDSTGDGFIIGFHLSFLPRLVDDYLDALQAELRGQADYLRSGRMSMRLRVSLNYGSLPRVADARLDSPVGITMIDTHRLVDGKAVRALLSESDPEVTFVAAVLSDRVYQDVVMARRTRLEPSEFAKTTIDIPEKNFRQDAWLRVPTPSGNVLRYGLVGATKLAEKKEVPAPKTPPRKEGNARSKGDGIVAGRDVDQSVGKTTIGGDQYNTSGSPQGDINVGPKSGRRISPEGTS